MMSSKAAGGVFARLKDLLRPPTPSSTEGGFHLPFGLTPGEWAELKTLTGAPGWSAYEKVLDALAKLDGERLLQSSQTEALHFIRGHVSGLRKAAQVIREIELREQEVERS